MIEDLAWKQFCGFQQQRLAARRRFQTLQINILVEWTNNVKEKLICHNRNFGGPEVLDGGGLFARRARIVRGKQGTSSQFSAAQGS